MSLSIKTTRRVLAAIVSVALILLWAPGLGLGKARAADPSLSFEDADGNLVHNSITDWADVGSSSSFSAKEDMPSGTTDNSYGQGAKEDDTSPTVVTGSIPNNKADLTRDYVYSYRDSDGHLLLYLAYETANFTGSAHIDFELNQSTQLAANGVNPVRTASPNPDVLITYDWNGSGAVSVGYATWLGSAWSDVTTFPAGQGQGASNTVTVHDPIANIDLAPGEFGEAGIDLTAAGLVPAGQCVDFASVLVKSRSSGESFQSELKDFIAPNTVNISNCGTIKVKKVTNPAGGTGFTFTGDVAGTIDDQGVLTVADLLPGTYTSTEAAKTGWDLTGLTCDNADGSGNLTTRTATFDVHAGEVITCTFTNTQRGTIIVKKVSDPPGGTGFVFTGDAAGTINDGGNITVSNLKPGTYHSTESDASGYSLGSITCDDAASATASTGDLATKTATFHLDPGETVTCTFSNTELATIIVKKLTVPSSSTETFGFTGDVTGSIGNGDTLSTTNLQPGTYTATEAAKAGWDLTALSCDDANSTGDLATRTATFNVEAGEVVTCTFTNTHKVALSITKAINANGDNVPAAGFVFSVSCTDGTTASVTFTEAGTKSVDGIIEGSSCDVTETPVTGWTVTPSLKQTVIVGPNGATVTFTNTRDVDKITVTKATSGAVAGASTVFTFDVVCPSLPAFNQTLTIDTSKASSATSTDIPTGTACTVTERSTTGWQQTTPASGGVDVTVPATAAFTNTRVTGPLQLSKSVTPTTGSYTAGAPGNTLTYTLTLKPTGLLDHTNVVVTDYIPGYDPSDVDSTGKQKSGLTVYVANSATCSTGCTATYDATKHLLTWNVGSVAHDSAAILLGFKVTIVKPASTVTSGIPASVIDNIGFVESLQQSKTPSNMVQVPVTAVLGVKVVRKPVQVLPFTGSKAPLQPLALVAMVMIGAGILMTSTRRCRAD